MKGRKALVFWVIHITLMLAFGCIIIFAGTQLPAIGPTIIIALVGNGATYIGGNVFAAWQKSKYYRVQLDEYTPTISYEPEPQEKTNGNT
jgi:hypothetical protein